jgi:hypothetical protein
MAESIHGFTLVETTDFKLAAFLRAHGAIDNSNTSGNANLYRTPDGQTIVVCVFDNAASTYRCFVRADLEGDFKKTEFKS